MSEIKVNKITPRAACGTTQLGDSGDTFTVPAGATISNLGTATGFGGTGVVSWDTASIKTTGFTAVTGTGYFCNTTGGPFTVTLPLSPSAGDVVGVADYAKTFDTDTLTLGRNGSNIGGTAADSDITTEGISVTLVYVDATKGWIVTDSGNQSDAPGPLFVTATGGCVTTCGNFKMHTFLSPNTLVVTCAGNPGGSTTVDYLVVAGGGAGWSSGANSGTVGGGGGAGGTRFSDGTASGCYTAGPAPLSASALPVSATPYAITVGGGGVAQPTPSPSIAQIGSNSIFSTITSTGGGGGGGGGAAGCIQKGGNGGGGGADVSTGYSAGTGNDPSTSPAQGNPGGAGITPKQGGGGGSVIAPGSPGCTSANPPLNIAARGSGATGLTSCITASPVIRGGGGGGANTDSTPNGGPGGGGTAPSSTSGGMGVAGTINTGGGGGGGPHGAPCVNGGSGGSGIVIIRYKYQ